MWIRIDGVRIRIHKIWLMRIRIKAGSSREKNESVPKPYMLATILGSDLINIITYGKKNFVG